jgi:benzoate/toluate 1,2-dioxygenase beta subunit
VTDSVSVPADLRAALAEFVLREARLLDDERFEEWTALFAEDGVYWAPAARHQAAPADHVSLFYDDKPTLIARVARLRHPQIHVQTPPSRACRILSDIALVEACAAGDRYRTRASFLMLEHRPGIAQRLYGGRCEHSLRRKGESFEIVLKRVDLVNCDAAFPALAIPF